VISSYTQIRTMGRGTPVLFGLRNALFTKLQDLPVAFFNQNKAGDLISRRQQRHRQAEPVRRAGG